MQNPLTVECVPDKGKDSPKEPFTVALRSNILNHPLALRSNILALSFKIPQDLKPSLSLRGFPRSPHRPSRAATRRTRARASLGTQRSPEDPPEDRLLGLPMFESQDVPKSLPEATVGLRLFIASAMRCVPFHVLSLEGLPFPWASQAKSPKVLRKSHAPARRLRPSRVRRPRPRALGVRALSPGSVSGTLTQRRIGETVLDEVQS